MPRKRERFERSDVPRATPLRTVVSLFVLVGVAVGLYFLVSTLWRRANQVSGFADRALKASVRAQGGLGDYAEGFVASDHDIRSLLVFTTSDGALAQAQILSLDVTAGSGVLASLPLDTRVSFEDAALPLARLYAEQGASTCVAPVAAAANVQIAHVVVADDDLWDKLGQLRSGGLAGLLGSAADILETINTDMSTDDLFGLAEIVQRIGVGGLSRVDAPVSQEQLEDGTTVSVIDQTQLGVQLGLLVAPEPAEDGGEA